LQEHKIIKSILIDYFDEEYIDYDEEENSFQVPIGVIAEFDDVWHISFDLTYVTDPRDTILFSTVLLELANHQIMCAMDCPFYTIFNEEDICVDVLWDTSIMEKMLDSKKSYNEVKEELIKEILDKDLVENKKQETQIASNLN
jgi:hypothetical protein